MTESSLQRRLFLWLTLPLLLSLPVLGTVLYHQVKNTAQLWLDEALEDTALTLASQLDTQDRAPHIEISANMDRALRFDRQDEVFYLVIGPNRQVLSGDASLLAARVELPLSGAARHADVQLQGRHLRLVQLAVPCGSGRCEVLVGETLNKRDALRRQIGGAVSLAGAAIVLVLGVAGWWAIRRGLTPLTGLSAELERRDLQRLEPMTAPLPRELRPLQAAFNRLFDRLRQAADAQRHFLADAAHQLRTPLTSLLTEIELAQLEPHDPRVEPLLERLRQQVQRSARLAQQLLSLARSEARGTEADQPLDLRGLATQFGQDWAPDALRAGGDLGFELATAPVRGQAYLLRELLENLVHNAVVYAGPQARITVRSGCDAREAWLEVEDDGPGIPAAERPAALQRFRRGNPAVGTGSGLGLAIAADIAQRHGGRLELLDASEGQGLRVRLTLARSDPPS